MRAWEEGGEGGKKGGERALETWRKMMSSEVLLLGERGIRKKDRDLYLICKAALCKYIN